MKRNLTSLLMLFTCMCVGQPSTSIYQTEISYGSGETKISESFESRSSHLPIINSERIWYCTGGGAFEPSYSFRFSYSSDSVLRGEKYYFERIRSGNEDGSNSIIEGYYREEGGILYESTDLSGGENIIFDITLEEGDIVSLDEDGFSDLVVTEVNTIQLDDGIERKKLSLQCQENPSFYPLFEWIEGIGVLLSVKPYCALDNFDYRVVCLTEGEDDIYTDENVESCWLMTSTNDLEKSSLTIVPNPAHNEITIENIVGDFDYSIFDISGKIIMSSKSSSNKIIINHLPQGLYILNLKNSDVQKQLKFIKS